MDTKRVRPSQPNLQSLVPKTPEAQAIIKAFGKPIDPVDALISIHVERDPDAPVTVRQPKARPATDNPLFTFDQQFNSIFGGTLP